MGILINRANGVPVASRLTICETPWTRTRGLIGTRRLEAEHVYWIKPCNAIHSFFMTMTIDVAFLDADLRVVKVIPAFTPFRICLPVRGAHSVLEGAAGMLERTGLREGVQLVYRPDNASPFSG